MRFFEEDGELMVEIGLDKFTKHVRRATEEEAAGFEDAAEPEDETDSPEEPKAKKKK